MKCTKPNNFIRKEYNLGFTLIELLAVIVILAVIALISTPIVLNIINKSKKSSFTDTAYGIIESARLLFTEQILDGGMPSNKEFKFDGSSNELSFNGTKPKGGSLILTDKGEVTLAIHNGVWCATKAKNESKVHLKKYEEDTCIVPDDIEIPDTPVTPEKKEFTFEEKMKESNEVMSIDPDHNPRYVGINPNNYVKFNDELWRIIGVFNGQAKIIRNEFYSTGKAWDENSSNGGHGSYGYNDWSVSTLKTELNGTYLDSINETYRNMIVESHTWNLGGSYLDTANLTRTFFYNGEKGTEVYDGRSTEWTGVIGLMYASDYGYSTSAMDSECDETMWNWNGTGNVANCRNNSWLYKSSNMQWTLSPLSSEGSRVYILDMTGEIGQTQTYRQNSTSSPVLYLKPEVKIISGNGSSESPFELRM